MKYIDEFRRKGLIKRAIDKIIAVMPARPIRIMEVCGTHTQSFLRFGLDKIIPGHLKLITGPGCPVCVSPQQYIDRAIDLARAKDAIILTFGDMLRVPGSSSSLEEARAEYANVQVVYSALDSLQVARRHPGKQIIFLAVGFETTAPTIALTILSAKKEKIRNLCFYSSLKLIPPAMAYLAKDKRLRLDAFLCPGHVSAIIGTKAYQPLLDKYQIACCVAGFEPLDILEGIYLLLLQIAAKEARVANQYLRVVKRSGNSKARQIINRVFRVADSTWRGFGKIPQSGLRLKDEFLDFEAETVLGFKDKRFAISAKLNKCRCGEVLKGLILPRECPLFSRACSPDNPVGPCMVSSEGACNAYYRYRR